MATWRDKLRPLKFPAITAFVAVAAFEADKLYTIETAKARARLEARRRALYASLARDKTRYVGCLDGSEEIRVKSQLACDAYNYERARIDFDEMRPFRYMWSEWTGTKMPVVPNDTLRAYIDLTWLTPIVVETGKLGNGQVELVQASIVERYREAL